jgi:hypothetical protein
MKIKVLVLSILIIFLAGCADQIVSECDDTQPIAGAPKLNTFKGIQTKLFNTTCALSGCHGSNSAQANLTLTEGSAYSNLVNVQSTLFPQSVRVEPGDAENSLLISVLRGQGLQMPPSGKLDDAIIDSVAMWINNGALNN